MSTVVVGVGSNLGSREATIGTARSMLASEPGIQVISTSPLYETAPVGPPQPRYLNGAFRLETSLGPLELLRSLLAIEHRLGRVRDPASRWAARSVDLDILWDERGSVDEETLVVPHPELGRRRFALTPLLAVAPGLDSVFGPTLAKLGGPLRPWERRALIEEGGARGTVQVEADRIADACAIAVSSLSTDRLRSETLECRVDANPEALTSALAGLASQGLTIGSVTVSDCSDEQWTLRAHACDRSVSIGSRVCVRTTLASKRVFRVIAERDSFGR